MTVNLLGTPMRTPLSPTSLRVNVRKKVPHEQCPPPSTRFSAKLLLHFALAHQPPEWVRQSQVAERARGVRGELRKPVRPPRPPPGNTPALTGAHLGRGPPSPGPARLPHSERAPCPARDPRACRRREPGVQGPSWFAPSLGTKRARGRPGGGRGTFWTDP